MVIDPWALEKEMAELGARGIEFDDLVISDRAQLILPHHRALEAIAEERRGSRRLGTTARGIGPAYEDKAARRGLRMVDLLAPQTLPGKLEEARRHYEDICRGADRPTAVDWDALLPELAGFGERLRPRITDVSLVLQRAVAQGHSILFEGAQATLLDVDFGTYPYVTSSSAAVGGVASGLGIPPTRIDGALGIVKAYTTRVGSGPLPTEIGGALEEELRKRGSEYGASTGRPRRCGWFDAVVARYSVRINGFDSLALIKLDVLDSLAEIPVCIGYRHGEQLLSELPADLAVIEACEPVYETLPGWGSATSGVRSFDALPDAARRYIDRLAELVGCEIGIVSTGPDRHDTIFRSASTLVSWFE
jgi:adenylosuccinate synthase